MSEKKNSKTFEERLTEIENMAARLESGQLGLEESLRQYELGMKGLMELEKELGDARQRLTMVRSKKDGTVEEVPVLSSEKGIQEAPAEEKVIDLPW